MLIRRETFADIDPIRAVTAAAFARNPRGEAELVGRLRADEGWLPALSQVAEVDGQVVGHVVCTRAHIGEVPALGLGPLSVRPEHQRRGVGKALVHSVLGAAEALGEKVVVLLGSPEYYCRFGFRLAEEFGVTPPVAQWAPHFQLRPLGTPEAVPSGAFRYSEPFNSLP